MWHLNGIRGERGAGGRSFDEGRDWAQVGVLVTGEGFGTWGRLESEKRVSKRKEKFNLEEA